MFRRNFLKTGLVSLLSVCGVKSVSAQTTESRQFRCFENENGTKRHYLITFLANNEITKVIHRDGDLPAIEYANGRKEYHNYGKLHRDGDKPAITNVNGMKSYCKYGKLHRDGDKPAIEYPGGVNFYYKYDKLHRDGDKPAIEYANGRKYYYKNGEKYSPVIS